MVRLAFRLHAAWVPALLAAVSVCCLLPLPLASAAGCALSGLSTSAAAASADTAPALLPRTGVEGSGVLASGSSTLLSSVPLRRPDFLLSVDVRVNVLPAIFFVQLFTPNGGQWQVKRSEPVNIAADHPAGLTQRIALSWSVAAGDVVGFALPAGGNTRIVFDTLSSATDDASVAALPESWVNQWSGAPLTTVGAKLAQTPFPGALQRLYSFAINLQSECAASHYPLSRCRFTSASPLDRSAYNESDASVGSTTLLVGAPVSAGDVLVGVSMLLRQLEPFVLQVWRPAADAASWSLSHSQLVTPLVLGQQSLALEWPLQAGDVLGWSTQAQASAAGGPFAFDLSEATAQPASARVMRVNNQGMAPHLVTSLFNTALAGDNGHFLYRRYAVQLYTRVACALQQRGAREFVPLDGSDDGSTTLLTASAFNGSALLSSVSFLPSSTHAMHVQLFSSALLLRFSMEVVPSASSVASGAVVSVRPNWPLAAGDILAIRGVNGISSPVAWRGISDEEAAAMPSADAAQYMVTVNSETQLQAGSTLGSNGTVSQERRRLNLAWSVRPYGVCSGSSQVPAAGSIGTCSLLNGGDTCRMECDSGYAQQGATALSCDAASIGLLTGAQSCVAKPCSFELPSNNGGALMGTCNATLASGSTCFVLCPAGKLSVEPTSVSCFAATITSTFAQCITPQPCVWPAAVTQLPTGLLPGNCTLGATVPHGTTCVFEAQVGYVVVAGSLQRKCFNGATPDLPTLLPSPCPLPALTPHTLLGSCPNSGILASGGSACEYACETGYLPAPGSSKLNCSNGVLIGTATTCYKAPTCILPVTLPEGVEPGTCKGLTALSPLGGECRPTLLSGYTATGELLYSCELGVLSQNYSVVATPCTVPSASAAPTKHVLAGSCPEGAMAMRSGTLCDVECAPGYTTSSPTSFSCFFGELTGSLPTCRLPVCQLPEELPTGLLAGTCELGNMLRNDSEVYPASCTLALGSDYALSSAADSLLLSCTRDGKLSALPDVVTSVLPTYVRSSSCTSDLTSSSAASLATDTVTSCPAGQAMLSWDIVSCQSGVGVRVACSPNQLLKSSGPVVDVRSGTCVTNNLYGLATLGETSCPSNTDYAVVGMGFLSCNGNGVQLLVRCHPLIDESSKFTEIGLFANDHYQELSMVPGLFDAAASDSAPPRSYKGQLGGLRELRSVVCFPNDANYMSSIGIRNDGNILAQFASCRLFHVTLPGLLLSSVSWYGPAIHQRGVVSNQLPQCIIMQSTRVQTSGNVSAVALWVLEAGSPIIVQTYVARGVEYIVQGNFTFTPTQTGYQQIGIPASQRWAVNTSHMVGFCSSKQLVPADDIAFMPGWERGGLFGAHAVSFLGGAVAVGEAAGGGDDAGEAQHRVYSLQIAVEPESPSTSRPSSVFGFSGYGNYSSELAHSDRETGAGACALLDQPRIRTIGTISNFSFTVPVNDGIIMLQTYQEPSPGRYELTGSFTVPRVKRGAQWVSIGVNDTWTVGQNDLLAFCYTRTSLNYEYVYNPVARWFEYGFDDGFPQRKVYGRGDDFNGPHWMNFIGDGIQSTVGEVVRGGVSQAAYNDGIYLRIDRSYDIQIGITPRAACVPLAREAVFGNGHVECQGTRCTLVCNPGFGAAKAVQHCNPDASWEDQGKCLPVAAPLFTRSWLLPELSPYSVTFRWEPPASFATSGLLLRGWELQPTMLFPSNSDLELPALRSLMNSSALFKFGPLEQSMTLQLDSASQVEHVLANVQLRMMVSGGSSVWLGIKTAGTCACDVYRALRDPLVTDLDSDGHGSVQSGRPLDMRALQTFGVGNALMLSFLPNSLCTNQYFIRTTARDHTELPLQTVTLQTYKAASEQSCPFFHEEAHLVGIVAFPMYGRDLDVCITQGPMFVCSTCQSEYNSGVAPSSQFPPPPPVCIRTRLAFSVRVRGAVTTGKGPSSTVVTGVSGVTVHFMMLEFDTDEPVLVTQADGSVGPLIVTVLTDPNGKYDQQLSSSDMSAAQYKLRIWPTYTATDEASGLTTSHVFHSVLQGVGVNVTTETVTHNAWLEERSFIDESVVPVVGKVLISTTDTLYGSDAFQGCGMLNITVKSYALSDSTFSSPLSTAEATLSDGRFQLTAAIETTIVLVASQEGVNRTFDPPFLVVHVGVGDTVADPIFDVTTSKLHMQIDGGNCGAHIGSVRPAIFYDACGPSAHVLLPPFSSGAGAVYEVPSVAYTVKLFDSKDAYSGLQVEDVDGTYLPTAYVNGDVGVFVASQAPFDVDFRLDTLTQQNFSYRYFAPTELKLLNDFMCEDPLAQTEEKRYLIVQIGGMVTVRFGAQETYGYVGVGGEDRVQVCFNVTAGVEVLDGVTAPGSSLLAEYTGCSTGSHLCAIDAVYDGSESTVTYSLVAGELQTSNFQTSSDNVAHTQPYFTRVLQWRSAGSANPFQNLFVLIVGSQATEGALKMLYPPWDPLYILRDPPGSSSSAKIDIGNELETSTSLSLMVDTGIPFSIDVAGGGKFEKPLCVGPSLGAEFGFKLEATIQLCSVVGAFSLAVQEVSTVTLPTSTNYFTEQRRNTLKTMTSVSTSDDSSLGGGAGDLFLTVDGTFSLEISNRVSVDITPKVDPVTQKTSYTCAASVKPSLVWTEDPGMAYQWISQNNILTVLIPDLELTNTLLLEEAGVATLDELKLVDEAKSIIYQQNEVAVRGWKSLIDYNEELKESAVEWTDFWEFASTPGLTDIRHGSTDEQGQASRGIQSDLESIANSGDAKLVYKGSLGTEAEQRSLASRSADKASELSTPVKHDDPRFLGAGSNLVHLSSQIRDLAHDELSVNSIIVYGDPKYKALFRVEVEATNEQRFAREGVETYATENKGGFSIDLDQTNVIFNTNNWASSQMRIEHGVRAEFMQKQSNHLVLEFGDSEDGDMIHFKVFKDKAFGSPVYKVVGGRSSCPAEPGTVTRDVIEVLVNEPVFDRVHPDAAVSTSLTLINHSPTRESFDYSLTQLMESNKHGLRLYINGQVLTADTEALAVTVPYGVNVVMTLAIERGVGAYTFEQVRIAATHTVPSGGACSSHAASLSVYYDQPCSQIKFSGVLALSGSFLINAANAARSIAGAQLAISVRNPEFTLPGRRWLDQVANDGYLQTLDIQYRLDSSVSDADWQSIKRVGDTVPPTPLLKVITDGYKASPPTVINDVYTAVWDLSTLGNNDYQLRAVSQCDVPVGALDTSLYTHVSAPIRGTLDLLQPKLFGAPLPAVRAWLPGQPISASFTKTLACDSYYGKARVSMWINPTLVAGGQALGTTVDTMHVCSGNTISIQMYAPNYAQLVDRLVTVLVDHLVDTSGNPIVGDSVKWSFLVAPFDTQASSVKVTGLTLAGEKSALIASYTNLNGLQKQLATEIAKLINIDIDATLNPSPPAVGGGGIQAAAVQISNVRVDAATAGTTFDGVLQQLPTFPGDALPRFSPSDFSNHLLSAWRMHNHTSASQYPLLSTLLSSSNVVAQVQAVVAAPTASPLHTLAHHRSMSTMSAAGASSTVRASTAGTTAAPRRGFSIMSGGDPAYSLQSFKAGLQPASVDAKGSVDGNAVPRALLQLEWLVVGTVAQPILSVSDLTVEYMLVPDSSTEPDVAARVARVVLLQDGDVSFLLSSNAPASLTKGLYALQIVGFPTVVGGFTAHFFITVQQGMAADYVVDEQAFVVGPPSAPVLQRIAQMSADSVQVAFLPSAKSGVAAVGTGSDSDVSYAVSIELPSGVIVSVPEHLLEHSQSVPVALSGLPASELRTFSLAAAASELPELLLLSNGASVNWTVGVTAVSALSSAPMQTLPVTIGSLPADIPIYRVAQLSMSQYLVRFHASLDSAPLAYVVAVHLNGGAPIRTEFAPAALRVVPTNPEELLSSSLSAQLLEASIAVSASLAGYTSVAFSVAVRTQLGESAPLLHAVPTPYAALNAPTAAVARVVTGVPITAAEQSVQLNVSWVTPSIVRPTRDLLRSFDLSYSLLMDAGVLSAEMPLGSVDASVSPLRVAWSSAQFSVPFIPDPSMADSSRTYVVHVRATISSSASVPLAYRVDGMGVQILQSAAVSATVVLRPAAGSFTPGDDSTSEHNDTSSVIAPSVPPSLYPLEGAIDAAAPPAPAGLDVKQLAQQPLHVRVVFVPVAGAVRYQLSWFNASSSVTAESLLKSEMVGSESIVDGWLVHVLPNVLSASDLVTGTRLKFSLAAVSAAGRKSQRTIEYLQVLPQPTLLPRYTVHVRSVVNGTATAQSWPAQSYRLSGVQAWNVSIPLHTGVQVTLQPSEASQLRSVSALLTHAPRSLEQTETLFEQCAEGGRTLGHTLVTPTPAAPLLTPLAVSSADDALGELLSESAALLLPLSPCNGHSFTLPPIDAARHRAHVIYFKLVTRDFREHTHAMHIQAE